MAKKQGNLWKTQDGQKSILEQLIYVSTLSKSEWENILVCQLQYGVTQNCPRTSELGVGSEIRGQR